MRYSSIVIISLLCAGLLPLASYSQVLPDEVDVEVEIINAPLDSALLLLSKHSDINISYDPGILPAFKRVTFSNRLKLGLILDDLLYDTPLAYRIVGNQLVIVKDPRKSSQKDIVMSGYIRDAQTGEALVYANVFTDDFSVSDVSNEFGYYRVTISPGDQILNFSYVGYNRQVIGLSAEGDTSIDVALAPDNLLNEIVVIEEVPEKLRQAEEYDELPTENMQSMSNLAGEPDLFRMIHMRGGVSSGADGFGGINVRGGSQDQNLVLMDGVPIYNSGHALGLFSVFNPSMVKSAQLLKGSFPARYGGRLSSVLDVRTKDGNLSKWGGDFSVSPLLVRGMIEGPLKQGRSSMIVSGRRTIVDPWLKPLSKYQLELNDEDGFINFFFYDVNAKLNFELGEKDHLYISAYTGRDDFNNEVTSFISSNNLSDEVEEFNVNEWSWGNDILTSRWTHIFGKNLFSQVALSYSKFQFENFEFNRTRINPLSPNQIIGYGTRLFVSDIQDYIASVDFDYHLSKKIHLRWGVNHIQHELKPGVNFSSTRDDLLEAGDVITPEDIKSFFQFPVVSGSETRYYVENEWHFSKFSVLNAGVHFSSIGTDQTTYNRLQPRIGLKFHLNPKLHVKLGYTEMDQYLHLLSTSGAGLPNDVWIPSTDRIPPQRSKQMSGSIHAVLGSIASVTLSAYKKDYENLRALSSGGLFFILEDEPWDEDVPVGIGEAYGFEAQVEKRVGKFKGWINYTYAKTTRLFESLNEGIAFPHRNDRRHALKLSSFIQFNANVELNLSWTYSSGNPVTVPQDFTSVVIDNSLELIPLYGGINNQLLPNYHKLDFALNIYTKYAWGRQKLSLGAYNSYNRQNPFYVDIVRDTEIPNRLAADQVSILPLVPFVSIGISF